MKNAQACKKIENTRSLREPNRDENRSTKTKVIVRFSRPPVYASRKIADAISKNACDTQLSTKACKVIGESSTATRRNVGVRASSDLKQRSGTTLQTVR